MKLVKKPEGKITVTCEKCDEHPEGALILLNNMIRFSSWFDQVWCEKCQHGYTYDGKAYALIYAIDGPYHLAEIAKVEEKLRKDGLIE